jgi:chemotaxis protein methyltransferase CheR
LRDELTHMIDAVTTNKTDFFREPLHFECLGNKIVPEFVSSGTGRKLKVWSAGCSTGEEPYTLAMVLRESFRNYCGFGFSILATDISTIVLEKARLGIYDDNRTASIPWELKRKYFMINRDRNRGLVRITPELRSLVEFMRLNLIDDEFGLTEQKDIIFCRNVIIYFDRPTQEKLLNRLCCHLSPRGYLFLGHSETLSGFDVPLARVESTIYRKQK